MDETETYSLDRIVDYLKFRRERGYSLDEIIEMLESGDTQIHPSKTD